MSREQFARFKNQILGGTVLRDTNIHAEILGTVDFEFWRNIHETEPYLRGATAIRLDNVTKGRIILERLDAEPSPKRFAEMLLAVYEAMAYYSVLPKSDSDMMWLTYVHRLQAEQHATGFTDLEIKWIEEPKQEWTRDFSQERYYIPGTLEIKYVGDDWGKEESQKLLEGGFSSEILKQVLANPSQVKPEKRTKDQRDRAWYEKPVGIIFIGVLVTVIGGWILFTFHWN
jgi:hypothetical protein